MLTVIMAGGVGERFWPLSRRTRPKQLLDLTGDGSMIALTVERLKGISSPEETLVITNVDQRDSVVAALSGSVPDENVIGEPQGRNTAPCIGLAALLFRRQRGDVPMLVLPADHIVSPAAEFRRVVEAAMKIVMERKCLLTFGIAPTRAETGYGYIQAAEPITSPDGVDAFRAAAFLEKPDAERARIFLQSGTHFWNSGMFMWTTETILREITTHVPELGEVLAEIDSRSGTEPLAGVLESMYSRAPSISVDYGVMEKAAEVVVIKSQFDWNDVGSWEFVRDIRPADGDGNVVDGESIIIDGANNTVVSRNRLVAILGVDDVVVVDGGDTMLVCKRDRVQEVKRIVQALRDCGRDDLL